MSNTEKIKKIRQFVKSKSDKENWKYHVVLVVNYAKKLAKIYRVNQEIVELAALLHDIGRIVSKNIKDHDIIGVLKAGNILKKYDYPEDIIKEVKHCVESHRGSKNIKPRTLTAKIITNADAMAHFDVFPILIFIGAEGKFLGLQRKIEFEEIINVLQYKL